MGHYSSIGFVFSSDEDWAEAVTRLSEKATPIETPSGTYRRWTSPTGAELWIQFDADGDLVGAHPHFTSELRAPIRIERHVRRENQTVLDGAYDGWIQAPDDPVGFYPLVFDCANYRQVSATSLPATGSVQLALFAQQLWAFGSGGEFEDSEEAERGEVHFASQSFVPASSLEHAKDIAEAFMCGHVVASETRTNEITGHSFHWMQVETYGATYDVVADPALPRAPAGGVIKGTFWLSGFVEGLQSRSGRLARVLRRLRQARG